jgi:hypothetical protein
VPCARPGAVIQERIMTPSLSDLETRGFVVVPSFLSEHELETVRADFNQQPTSANRNYGVSIASPEVKDAILGRIEGILREVVAQTSLRPDLPRAGAYFATARGITFAWHQDHESFFTAHNHFDYLNFYIPIVKPVREKSNLCVVPFDTLERECPGTYRRLYRSGATRFIRLGTRRLVFCDDSGTVHLMRRDIEQLAETPLLTAGDLLLMRGDIVHRTQDAETERVSLSFRVGSSQAEVSRAALADGGLHKARMMANSAGYYERVFKAFDLAGKDVMTLTELDSVLATVPAGAPRQPGEFMKVLMAEKKRARVYGRFWPKVALGIMAGQLVWLSERVGRRP